MSTTLKNGMNMEKSVFFPFISFPFDNGWGWEQNINGSTLSLRRELVCLACELDKAHVLL